VISSSVVPAGDFGLVSLEWPQKPFASTASWKKMWKMTQLRPKGVGSSSGTGHDSNFVQQGSMTCGNQ